MKTFETLASLDFGTILAEAIRDNKTQTGRELLEKYSAVLMNSPVTCNLVNQFVNEARNYLYDSAVAKAVNKVSQVISENKISWNLATACENINANNSKYNYINRNAAEHVMELLEGRTEAQVVSYIKAGALKGDMFCESIRNIVKSVYKDQTIIIESSNYTLTHPVSYVEIVEGKTYFALGNRTFAINEDDSLYELHYDEKSPVSQKFGFINEMLNQMSYDGKGCFSYTLKGNNEIEYQIDEAGSVTRISNGEEQLMTVEEMRENNRLYLMTVNPARKNQIARVLEGIAQVAENFDNVVLVEEVSYVRTSKGKQFMIIEGKDCVNFTLLYSPTQKPFSKNYTSIVEALNDIKAICQLDLTSVFEDRINEEYDAQSAAEQNQIRENLEESSMQERRNKIIALTEAYKNDPATLAILSRLSLELSEL